MPPKSKYSKERILEAGIELLRKEGFSALSARSLSAALGCTTQPIFSAFENMDQLIAEMEKKARGIYGKYIEKGLADALPFKSAGLQFICFAKEEPKLFEFLFMRDPKEIERRFMPANDENAPQILTVLQERYGFEKERARSLYNHLSVYTYGLAITFLGKKNIFSLEDADQMLSEVFRALIKE